MRGGGRFGPPSRLGGGGPRKGAHVGACHPQPDLLEGDTLLLASLRGEGALQRLSPTLGVSQEHVSLEPIPRPTLSWGGGFTPRMTCQGTVEVSTCEGEETSLLEQQLDGWLALADSLRTSARVCLACIPSADEAMRNLGNFAFVASHLFSAARQHPSAVAKLIHIGKRLEELHTKVRGTITTTHLATTLLYDVSHQWSLCLNRCITLSSSEDVGAAGATMPFSLEPIFLELEGGRYVEPLLPLTLPLAELVSRIHGGGGGNSVGGGTGGGGGNMKGGNGEGCVSGGSGRNGDRGNSRGDRCGGGGAGSNTRLQSLYDVHLPALSLRDREKSHNILAGTALPTVYDHVICKKLHLCVLCWEDCGRKNLHVPTSPDVAATINGLLKKARGKWRSCL